MERQIRTWLVLAMGGLAACIARAQGVPASVAGAEASPAAIAEPTPVPAALGAAARESELLLSWAAIDHPSGIYIAASPAPTARLSIFLDNLSDHALPMEGEIAFGPRPGAHEEFKPLLVTPIAGGTVPAGQRAKVPLQVTFGATGLYELRFNHQARSDAIANPAGIRLQCIFAPRRPTLAVDSPWLTVLPPAAVAVPGYLTDYLRQTSVHRFLMDERFVFDADANIGLGFGASLEAAGISVTGEPVAEGRVAAGHPVSARDVDALFAEILLARDGPGTGVTDIRGRNPGAASAAELVLRVTVPTASSDPRMIAAFREYVAGAIARAQGSLHALVIAPDTWRPYDAEWRANFRAFYLAGYESAKTHDKNIRLLGAGSAQTTTDLLADLGPYIDAYAISDAAGQQALIAPLAGTATGGATGTPAAGRKPVWVLPPPLADPWALVPPASALAQGAAIVPLPPPEVDRGVAAHLLGGTVFFQRVHVATLAATFSGAQSPGATAPPPALPDLPFIAVYQGDGYAVAAIAGFSAGTPLDAQFPDLARTRTVVEPVQPDGKPPYANLEVSDDTHSMRVVDAAGGAVDCRLGGGGNGGGGDSLFIPASDRIVYLLQAGTADDLAGSLRTATPHRLPIFDVAAQRSAVVANGLTLRLHNISADEMSGTLRLIKPLNNNPASTPTALPTDSPPAPPAGASFPGAGADPSSAPAPAGSSPSPVVLFQIEFAAISPNAIRELSLRLPDQSTPNALLLEITTAAAKPLIQRTAIILQPDHAQ